MLYTPSMSKWAKNVVSVRVTNRFLRVIRTSSLCLTLRVVAVCYKQLSFVFSLGGYLLLVCVVKCIFTKHLKLKQ